MTPLLAVYRALGWIARPALSTHLAYRARRGKEDRARLGERRGAAGVPRPPGRLVWIHAASVGEALSALPLVDALKTERPDVSVLMTTGTRTSAALIAKQAPTVIHQFAPLDATPWVRRFLKHWKPDLALFMESELWPAVLTETRKQGIPAALVNGRISEKSFRSWTKLRGVFGGLFAAFDRTLVQTVDVKKRFERLGILPEKIVVTGDIKASRPAQSVDTEVLQRLRDAIGSRPLWLAASTHPGEEEAVASAHGALSERTPDFLTIIAPRHPERGDEIAEMLQLRGLSCARWSRGEDIGSASVLLADTLGEMPLWYAVSPLVFVGAGWGSLGGHNLLEPAQTGCAVLSGPHVANFTDAFETLDRLDALRVVASPNELRHAALDLLGPDGWPTEVATQMGEAGRVAAAPDPEPLRRTMAALEPLISRALA